jgi:hypothetical protein
MQNETALTTTQHGEVAIPPAGDSFLAVIAAAARDPQVDPAKMTALLELKERIDAKQAEIEFNRAFSRLQLKLPRVKKNGTIDLGRGKPIPFAKWEDVDAVIRPILAEEGFALSFTGEPNTSGVTMTCHLKHVMGHAQTSTMQLPPDAGPGRNALQAIGSSHSYGKRYLACDILNIITEGADDNGRASGFISNEQALQVRDMISECGLDKARVGKLLAIAGVTSVEHIQKHQFDAIIESLRSTLRQKQGAR